MPQPSLNQAQNPISASVRCGSENARIGVLLPYRYIVSGSKGNLRLVDIFVCFSATLGAAAQCTIFPA
jgi:hypothetical protein